MVKKKVKKAKRVSRKRPVQRHKKKVVFLLIDGLPDLPINNKTPLSVAEKPNFDYLARNGVSGQIIPVERRLWSDLTRASVSHIGVTSLFGFDPKRYYLRRGPVEAVGAGIPYRDGWLALRCNFATVDNELKIVDRRVGRNSTGLDEIARFVNEHVNVGVPHIFKRTYEHRAVLVLKEKLGDKISDSDPYVPWQRVRPVEALSSDSQRSARLVQDFIDKTRGVIQFHPANERRINSGLPPANYLVTREAGNKMPAFSFFTNRHKISKAVAIAENGVMKGICMLLGFDSITIPEMKTEQTLKFIFENISNSLAEYDFVFAHIKAPDEPGHDGDFNKKQEMIELIDKKMENFRNFRGILVVSSDHITSTQLRRHEFGPVPVLVYGKGKDDLTTFDEFSVKKGKLKLTTGTKLWNYVFSK